MMCANHNDVIVMRHPLDGSLQWAADVANIPVINGGDGKNEHPTQALLDVLTIYALTGGRLDGIRVGFGGDLSHGRTVRSLSLALSHFDGVTIRWAAEDFLGMPDDLSRSPLSRGVRVEREKSRPRRDGSGGLLLHDAAAAGAHAGGDAERHRGDDEAVQDRRGRRWTASTCGSFIPLPVNSEIAEIDYRVYFTPAQAFFTQAEFGVFLRKALLHEMLGHEGYHRYDGRLPAELAVGNNRLPRRIRAGKQSAMFIDRIHDGTVIDHLVPGSLRAVSDALDLENRGYSCTTATLPEKKNPFIKTSLPEPGERDLKTIALLSPEPTIDAISGGRIAAKFVYLLCANTNCITRVVNEDVPPRFYRDGDAVRCRYCRRQYTITSRKATEEEQAAWIAGLPAQIDPVEYPD